MLNYDKAGIFYIEKISNDAYQDVCDLKENKHPDNIDYTFVYNKLKNNSTLFWDIWLESMTEFLNKYN